MSESRTIRRAELTREDLDALDRFSARLREIDGDHASIVSRATRSTVGAALCEAARRIGVTL